VTTPGDGAEPSDRFAEVLASARTGAGWGSTLLWVEYSHAVAAFLKARGAREPEDLTSEVFIAAFDRLPQFVGDEAQFRSFLFSIAYRRLVDEFRTRGRRGDNASWSADTDTRSTPSAEDVAIARVGDESALSLLDSLPPEQRDVMVLRIVSDLTVEQIATVLGKRPGAVKALQRRALERLRKNMPPTRTPLRDADDGR
jgi:RNA polymerase sigma factor (sigma-70 family)